MAQDRLAQELQEYLVDARLHALAAPCCGQDDTDQVSLSFSSHATTLQRAGFAKIMRPAAVCSADVTSTVMDSFM